MTGIGDDAAAVFVTGRPVTMCSDLSIEGVHFDFDFSSLADVGHKSVTRSLSDLAAMASAPICATISIAVPKSWRSEQTSHNLDEFYRGAAEAATEYGCALVGGDLSRSPGPLVIDVAAIGEMRERSSLWMRSGIRPGDEIFVTGKLGGAALALEMFRAQKANALSDTQRRLHLRPRARFDVAMKFASHPVSGAIDITDGLATDLLRICQASDVSADISEEKIPIAQGASLEHALRGGDDYELLLFLPSSWAGCDFGQRELAAIGAIHIGKVDFVNEGKKPEVRLSRAAMGPGVQIVAGHEVDGLGHDPFRDGR